MLDFGLYRYKILHAEWQKEKQISVITVAHGMVLKKKISNVAFRLLTLFRVAVLRTVCGPDI